jgi:hypothetical protein
MMATVFSRAERRMNASKENRKMAATIAIKTTPDVPRASR